MRRTRMLVAICFVLIVTPMLMGARAVGIVVMPNPGGNKGEINGNGFYTLENTDNFTKVEYIATNSGTLVDKKGEDATGGGSWTKTLLAVPAGTYNPNVATLYYTDGNAQIGTLDTTDTNNYTVK